MQNKMISFACIMLTLTATGVVHAQDLNAKVEMPAVANAAEEVKVLPAARPVTEVKTTEQAAAVDRAKAAQERLQKFRAKKEAEARAKEAQANELKVVEKKDAVAKSVDMVKAENKRRLDEELKNTVVAGKGIVDFTNRSSLGSLELTPLPGLNESAIAGPLPMGKSVSSKDLPSEQLLGRITPEVFQEMADLERGNTFLKLQLEKEKLKNDLEQMKATYRQKRLDEIAKREDVVRSRIQWWQEQEKLRLAIEKKKAEEEALARKVAEKEAERERVREETMKRLANNGHTTDKKPRTRGKAESKPEVLPPTMEELYVIESIRGVGKNLSAKIRSKTDGMELTVKRDDILPSGHVVKEVKKDSVMVSFGKRLDQLVFRPNQK